MLKIDLCLVEKLGNSLNVCIFSELQYYYSTDYCMYGLVRHTTPTISIYCSVCAVVHMLKFSELLSGSAGLIQSLLYTLKNAN